LNSLSQLTLSNPLWLSAIPLFAIILYYICRKNELSSTPSVWLFLYKNSINPETLNAQPKKLNLVIYCSSLISLSCLALILSGVSSEKKALISIQSPNIAEQLSLNQKEDLLFRINKALDKLKLNTVLIALNKLKAPTFYDYLKSKTTYSIVDQYNKPNELYYLINCGLTTPKDKTTSFIPIYNGEDSWGVNKTIHVSANSYELNIYRDSDLNTELQLLKNGKIYPLKTPLNKNNNIVNIKVEPGNSIIQVIPDDSFNANNQILIVHQPPNKVTSNISIEKAVIEFIEKNHFHTLQNNEILLTDNYHEWNTHNGFSVLFENNKNVNLELIKISDINEHHLWYNPNHLSNYTHSILNWPLGKLPQNCFNSKNNSLFFLGEKSVVKIYPMLKKITCTFDLDVFSTTEQQKNFMHALLNSLKPKDQELSRSIPKNLKKRIIQVENKQLNPRKFNNILLIFSLATFMLGMLYEMKKTSKKS
jgi:hypothetical protein